MNLLQIEHLTTQKTFSLRISSEDLRLTALIHSALHSFEEIKLTLVGEEMAGAGRHMNIIDCRGSFPQTWKPESVNLALITPEIENRATTFSSGFSDFITWPIVPAELYVRLLGRSSAWSSTGQSHVFSRVALVEKICSYIVEDLQRSLSIKSLVKRFGSNHNTINRLFNQELGMPPAAWQRKMRLEAAARRLSGSNEAITEIAAECGYPSPNNFATAFKRHFGVTPFQHRRNETRKAESERRKRN